MSQIKIERRYVWEVPNFTPQEDVYKLLVIVQPTHSSLGPTIFRRVEVYDPDASGAPHLVFLRERHTHSLCKRIPGGLAAVLGDALADEQLRGRTEEHAVWALVWEVMTEKGRSSALAREWVPEWAAWLDGLKEPMIPAEEG